MAYDPCADEWDWWLPAGVRGGGKPPYGFYGRSFMIADDYKGFCRQHFAGKSSSFKCL